MKKMFWSFVCAFSFLFLLPGAAFADPEGGESAEGAAEDKQSHEEKDKILTCENVAECAAKARAQTKRVHTWEKCEVPGDQRITFEDGKYTVRVTENTAHIEQGACVCPEGYELSKTWRVTNVTKSEDGTKTEYYKWFGVCLPTNIEPNAEVIAEGLNRLMKLAAETSTAVENADGKITGVIALVNGHELKIDLNAKGIEELREQLRQLEGRVDRHQQILGSMCEDPYAPKGVRDLCDAVAELQRNAANQFRWRVGGGFVVSSYEGRSFYGPSLEASFQSPRLTAELPLRLEFGGQASFGSASSVDEDGSSGAALDYQLYVGPVFDLDQQSKFQLHVSALGKNLYDPNGDIGLARGVGGRVAFSFCPQVDESNQKSVCIVPEAHIVHGTSIFHRTPTEQHPSPPMRGESGVSLGAGIGILGQF
mgnify:CR=1 FL=1